MLSQEVALTFAATLWHKVYLLYRLAHTAAANDCHKVSRIVHRDLNTEKGGRFSAGTPIGMSERRI